MTAAAEDTAPLTRNQRVAARRLAIEACRRGEFVLSAMITNEIGEQPVWSASADQQHISFRDPEQA